MLKIHGRITEVVIILVLFAAVACKKTSEPSVTFKPEMRDSYGAAYALFRDIWTPERFGDPQNRSDIISLIDRLSKNFHGVEKKTSGSKYDPGFAVALELNQRILQDAKRRFSEGYIDYAAWRLRGLTHNCIACHTRYQAPVRFIGEVPTPASTAAEDILGVADFLVATRQFERASAELLKLASAPGGINSSEQAEFRALKLWLVVQLKSKPAFKLMAHQLTDISALGHFRGETTGIVEHWIADLSRLASGVNQKESLEDAKLLLSTLSSDNRFIDDDESLVKTLYATTILHNLLTSLTGDFKREAACLLGLAYHHIQIEQLNVFSTLFLEQCIEEFPNTVEAQKSFKLIEEEIEFLSSGSGGIQMEEEDRLRLETLRKLAFGLTKE